MKFFSILLVSFLIINAINAQRPWVPSEQVILKDMSGQSVVLTLADLGRLTAVDIGNVKITNHKGEFKKEYQAMKGIPIKSILDLLTVTTEKPKDMSTYYYVFRATDGHSNIYSWNELYNADIGNHVYIVTGYQNQDLLTMPERIVTISTRDINTGRRFLKNLESIELKKVE